MNKDNTDSSTAIDPIKRQKTDLPGIFGPNGLLHRKVGTYEFRESQLAMAEAVARALAQRSHLCVEAGPGTGKTLAYLVPAILSGVPVIVSTATKALQSQLTEKDLPLLCSVLPVPFTFTQAKGRANYLCKEKLRNFKNSSPLWNQTKLRRLSRWCTSTESGDLSELKGYLEHRQDWPDLDARKETCHGLRCPQYSDCFITLLRRRIAEVDVLVVNHHLFFADMALKLEAGEGILPEGEVVIFDEAHRLEETATYFFAVSVSHPFLEEWWRDAQNAKKDFGEDWESMQRTVDTLREVSRSFFFTHRIPSSEVGLKRYWPDRTPEERLPFCKKAAESLHRALDEMIRNPDMRRKSDRVAILVDRLAQMRRNLAFNLSGCDEDYVYCFAAQSFGLTLQALPLEVSRLLADNLFQQGRTVILTSATLSASGDFSFVRQRLGLRHTEEMILPTEYRMSQQAILYIPDDLAFPKEQGFSEAMAEKAIELLTITEGRAFLLFTSIAQMKAVHDRLVHRIPYPLLLQGKKPADLLLREFRRTPHAVLLGVQSFWQGVDVQGEALSCVIVEKIPFSVPTDPLVSARLERIREQGGNPFMEYQIPEAILHLKQGLGRLIRSRTDRGILALFDRRILTRPYGRLFRESLPDCRLTHDLEEVHRFFRSPADGRREESKE